MSKTLFNRGNLIHDHNIEKDGFLIHYFLVQLEDTFNKSAKKELEDFFKKYNDISKWMIFSDYVLYDKNKQNDVMTFSIVPYVMEIEKYKQILNSLAPRDIKKMNSVNDEFINFLNNFPILNLSFVLSKRRKFDYIDEKEYLIKKTTNALKMFRIWSISTPGAQEKYLNSVKSFEALLRELNKKSPNYKIIRDIDILSSLIGFIGYQIASTSNIEVLSWLSDRDSMLTFGKNEKMKRKFIPYAFELATSLYHVLCDNNLKKFPDLICADAETKEKNLWYDEFLRIPDLIAGTIADYNFDENKHSHDKFVKVTERLLTNQEKVKTFHINLSIKNDVATSRLRLIK